MPASWWRGVSRPGARGRNLAEIVSGRPSSHSRTSNHQSGLDLYGAKPVQSGRQPEAGRGAGVYDRPDERQASAAEAQSGQGWRGLRSRVPGPETARHLFRGRTTRTAKRSTCDRPQAQSSFLPGTANFSRESCGMPPTSLPYSITEKFTTFREAVLAHAGEALASRMSFIALPPFEQDAVIEFLRSLQVLPAGTHSLVVDETGNAKGSPNDRARVASGYGSWPRGNF